MTDLRTDLIATARAMQPAGLNRGTAGNVSVRDGDGFLITPTGLPYDTLARRRHPAHGARRLAHEAGASLRPNGASTATSTPPGRKSAPCCTRTRRSPSAWPACAATFRPSIT